MWENARAQWDQLTSKWANAPLLSHIHISSATRVARAKSRTESKKQHHTGKKRVAESKKGSLWDFKFYKKGEEKGKENIEPMGNIMWMHVLPFWFSKVPCQLLPRDLKKKD